MPLRVGRQTAVPDGCYAENVAAMLGMLALNQSQLFFHVGMEVRQLVIGCVLLVIYQ